MLVRTPVVKIGLDIRETSVVDDRVVLQGVASAMPCAIEIEGKELLFLVRNLLRPAAIRLMLRALFRKDG